MRFLGDLPTLRKILAIIDRREAEFVHEWVVPVGPLSHAALLPGVSRRVADAAGGRRVSPVDHESSLPGGKVPEPNNLRDMTHARWSRRAVLLAGGLLVTGCSDSRRPTIQSEDYDSYGSNKKHLREILERRAKALMDKDEKGYLADLDQANTKLVQREKFIFDNLRQFDLAEIRFITDRATERSEGEGGDIQFRPVIRITKLTADAGPGDVAPAETFLYTLREKSGRFVVTDIIGATRKNYKKLHLDGPLAYAPWNTDKLHVVKVGKKVWLVGDESVTDLDRYAAVTEKELRLVEGMWGDRLSYPGHVLFFTRDLANVKQWFDFGAAENFLPDILGFQARELGVQKNGMVYGNEYAASRVVVNLRGHQRSAATPRSRSGMS